MNIREKLLLNERVIDCLEVIVSSLKVSCVLPLAGDDLKNIQVIKKDFLSNLEGWTYKDIAESIAGELDEKSKIAIIKITKSVADSVKEAFEQ